MARHSARLAILALISEEPGYLYSTSEIYAALKDRYTRPELFNALFESTRWANVATWVSNGEAGLVWMDGDTVGWFETEVEV